MKLHFVALLSLIATLVPATAQASPVYRPELHAPVQAAALVHLDAFKPLELEPAVPLELVKVPVKNPCHGGCGYGAVPLQCTRYAAIMRERMGAPVPSDLGDARFWAVNAAAAGLPVDDKPDVGDVAVSTAGKWGHVLVVIDVNPDGSFVATEGNFDYAGSVRDRLIPAENSLTFIGQ